jgi:hypothetical protein
MATPSVEEILDDTTPALSHLGFDAERAGLRVTRDAPRRFTIWRSEGVAEDGLPLWGVVVHLTKRHTFQVAKRYDGPHVTTVHTIQEIRHALFD